MIVDHIVGITIDEAVSGDEILWEAQINLADAI